MKDLKKAIKNVIETANKECCLYDEIIVDRDYLSELAQEYNIYFIEPDEQQLELP